MGGKALNKYGVYTERKNTVEFKTIATELQFSIYYYLNLTSAVVKCYHKKEDHGDLDLLLKIDRLFPVTVDLRKFIQETFKPQAVHYNGGVYSFDYKNFQIDFIPIREEKWDTAVTYYSYDPLGNIMGKTFHKFGLSYGWDGLFYKFRNFNGRLSQNILLTTDAKKIFDIGGYDHDRYLDGFDTLEEIFNYAIDCKYFDTEIFQMKNLKSIDKKRNRKRGSYHLFLKYLEKNNINITYPFDKNKDNYLQWIDLNFPEVKFMEKLAEFKKIDERNRQIAENFNGHMVMEWIPELYGKELGNAIKKFQDYLGDSFGDIVIATSTDELRDLFLSVYEGRTEQR